MSIRLEHVSYAYEDNSSKKNYALKDINLEIKPKGCGIMTHKKRPSTEKMYDYKKEKVEFARELGVNGANNTEVNAKMAAQDEAKYSKETMNRKHRFVNPQDSENHRY